MVLHVPRDLFAAEVAPAAPEAVVPASGGVPAPDQVDAIVRLLTRATAPVIVAGGGFKWRAGSESLVSLAEGTGIPVVASTGHADVMPHDHPLYAGQAGPRGNAVASSLLREADLLLVIGARLGFKLDFPEPR